MLTSTTAACVVVWAGSWAWDWRLGLLLTVAAPLFAELVRAARRLMDHGKSISEPAERELATRVVEIARCQGPALVPGRHRLQPPEGRLRTTASVPHGAPCSGRPPVTSSTVH
nr:hypothetical protein [Actinomyces viscosus]